MTATTTTEPAGGYPFADPPAAGGGAAATGAATTGAATATGATTTGGYHQQLLDHLAEMLDPLSRRRLHQAGVHAGSRCLEIGAGAGSIARWLAGRVGPGGEVVATDLDPSHVPPHPRLTRLTHDIATDPLPGQFDLIHARLVLAHLPDRDAVLHRLVAALTPGGALVIEEFDASWDRCVLYTPDPDAHRLLTAYHHALMAVLLAAGTDPAWGRRTHHAMRTAGLADVESEFWSRSWHGGQAGCLLAATAGAQLHHRLIAAGMDPADLDRLGTLLLDPRLVVHGNTAVSTIGRMR